MFITSSTWAGQPNLNTEMTKRLDVPVGSCTPSVTIHPKPPSLESATKRIDLGGEVKVTTKSTCRVFASMVPARGAEPLESVKVPVRSVPDWASVTVALDDHPEGAPLQLLSVRLVTTRSSVAAAD